MTLVEAGRGGKAFLVPGGGIRNAFLPLPASPGSPNPSLSSPSYRLAFLIAFKLVYLLFRPHPLRIFTTPFLPDFLCAFQKCIV